MKTINVVSALIVNEGRIFATLRGYGEFKDWWEFSGGKEEPVETPEDALVREIREEFDTEISVDRDVTTVEGTTLAFTSICVAICVAEYRVL